MESYAFPNKIKLTLIENVFIDEYFLSPKIMQKCSKLNVFSMDALENTLLLF